ncbi:MAG: hypothetical protein EZS28_056605, partial [Streblomastix strix]
LNSEHDALRNNISNGERLDRSVNGEVGCQNIVDEDDDEDDSLDQQLKKKEGLIQLRLTFTLLYYPYFSFKSSPIIIQVILIYYLAASDNLAAKKVGVQCLRQQYEVILPNGRGII